MLSGASPTSDRDAQLAARAAWRVIRCPDCHGELTLAAQCARCAGCGRQYDVGHGVLRCTDDQDAFYEEAYLNEVRHVPGANALKDWVFFALLQSGVFGKLRRVLKPGAIVLDVGCASGVRWLGNYHTVGIDLSFSSVRKTQSFYEVAAQASAERMPVASASVDVLYSSYFFEHVPAESKDACLREFSRVLRPDAHCVLLFDVLSDGPFGRFARREAAAFQRGFVDKDGHVGLELLSRAIERMEHAGLKVEQVMKFGTTPLQYPASYQWLDSAYGHAQPWVRALGNATRALSASRLRLPVELLITAFDTAINRYTSPDNATRAIVVARRTLS